MAYDQLTSCHRATHELMPTADQSHIRYSNKDNFRWILYPLFWQIDLPFVAHVVCHCASHAPREYPDALNKSLPYRLPLYLAGSVDTHHFDWEAVPHAHDEYNKA